MKFYFRRALAGVIVVPMVALMYVVGVAVLIAFGATPTFSVDDAWATGLMLGIVTECVLLFSKVSK